MNPDPETHSPPRREDYEAARGAMLGLARGFTGLTPTERKDVWRAFDALVLELAAKGWRRGDLYRLVVDLQDDEGAGLSQDSLDALYDYDTALTGHVSRECIVRLPGEPSEPEEFLRYVYGEKWMHPT